MIINGQKFKLVDTFDVPMTVPDCLVVPKNKIGSAHGEAKLYVSSKDKTREFYGGEGFCAKCFVLKQDLLAYMNTIKHEYFNPSQDYRAKDSLNSLWTERVKKIEELEDVIEFVIQDQTQIAGVRGYVNSKDFGYGVIREVSLPLVSYISAMELLDHSGTPVYYWKLFADFDAISNKADALVLKYGKANQVRVPSKSKERKNAELQKARIGQGPYRDKLLNESPFCPITMINDERLLIASHIKPWAVSSNKERVDPKNGFILSPLYDKLFDKGFITFTDNRHVRVSNWLSPQNKKRIGLKDDDFIQLLPIDEQRMKYLDYHRKYVLKG